MAPTRRRDRYNACETHVFASPPAGAQRAAAGETRARAGLDDVRIHDLRHSYASRALAAGESLSTIGKLLGRAGIRSTARYAQPPTSRAMP